MLSTTERRPSRLSNVCIRQATSIVSHHRMKHATLLCAVLVALLQLLPRHVSGQSAADLADHIEATSKQYNVVRYTAVLRRTHNTRAFVGEPLLVECAGRYQYASDGRRWRVQETREIPTSSSTHKTKSTTKAGFDGNLFYEQEGETLFLGVDAGSGQWLAPAEVFWRGGIRTSWLLSALRRPEAEVVDEVSVYGAKCLHIRSAWPSSENAPTISFDISLSPDQAYLPRRVRIERGGKLDALWEMPEVAQTDQGFWYPRRIRIQRPPTDNMPLQELTIEDVQVGHQPKKDEFALPSPLPSGIDVVDYCNHTAWHNDPWFCDLAPWLQVTYQFPRPSTGYLRDLRSYCAESLAGQPAPPLKVAHWILGSDPGPWKRPGRQVTVLFFFGGRAITPTPREFTAPVALQQQYGPLGLDIVAVATASQTPELTIQSVRQYALPFPVAIDARCPPDVASSTPGSHWGATFAAFGQTTYTGVVVIDRQGNVLLVTPDESDPPESVSSLESVVRRELKGEVPLPDPPSRQLSDRATRELKKEWLMLVAATKPAASISGRATITGPHSSSGADRSAESSTTDIIITATPEFRLLSSDIPGGWTLLIDRTRTQSIAAGADGSFSIQPIHKGTWKLVARAPGLASLQRTIHLETDDARVNVDFTFSQSSSIHGVVRDTDGQPIAGAAVKAVKRHLTPGNPRMYTTEHVPREGLKTDDHGIVHIRAPL